MEQLICHLIGDYWLQTNQMAQKKTVDINWAIIHAFLYTLPFVLIAPCFKSFMIIYLTHIIIDRYRLSYKLCKLINPDLFNAPDFLKVWILIIQDNTIHLLINYLALQIK